MKNVLVLSLALGLTLSACRPKAEEPPQPAVRQTQQDTTQKLPEYTREELMEIEAANMEQAQHPAEVPAHCTSEAQQVRMKKLAELHQEMLKRTTPQERHAISTEYSDLQTEEASCYKPQEQQ